MEDDEEDDEKAIPKTVSVGRGQQTDEALDIPVVNIPTTISYVF